MRIFGHFSKMESGEDKPRFMRIKAVMPVKTGIHFKARANRYVDPGLHRGDGPL